MWSLSSSATILATDFFSVGAVLVKRLYILFAIEHASRRAHLLGVTDHPGDAFVITVPTCAHQSGGQPTSPAPAYGRALTRLPPLAGAKA